MRKIIATLSLLAMGLTALAGTVNGTLTRIRVSDRDNEVKFESKVPDLTYRVRKIDIVRGMTRHGKTTARADIERMGIKARVEVTLDRVANGLYIKSANNDMFITEKELEGIRR